jgi:predicted DsbA family dithiol-disulfide isomerase
VAPIDVALGTIAIYSDLACPWATLAVHRLLAARKSLGLDGHVVLDHRAFPLELFNSRATPRRILEAEIPVVGALAPEAGWQQWRDDPYRYPVTTLPALEAVQAAKEQSLWASEQLDRALRRAFFASSACVSLRHVILEAGAACDALDVPLLEKALDDGRARRAVIDQKTEAEAEAVRGSPHLFFPDGSDVHNPGIEMHWEERAGEKLFPIVDRDDPSVYEDLIRRAAD